MNGLVQAVITTVLFFGILGILVLIHELGHFVVARLANVQVLEFGVGFPPRAKVLGQGGVHPADEAQYQHDLAAARGEPTQDAHEALLEAGPPRTIYTLNWLPIGGFVKLAGEDGDSADRPRAFSSKPLATRLLILASGVVMNVLLAFAIFTAITWLASPYIGAQFSTVQADSPAAGAGLKSGDAIVAIDGQRFQFLTGPNLLAVLRDKAGQHTTLTIVTPGSAPREVEVTLRDPSQVDANHGALGIGDIEASFDGATTTNDLGTAISVGADETVRWMGLIVGGLGTLLGSIAANPGAPPPVSGPIGIAIQIGEIFFKSGPVMTLYTAGILSANLAVVNILPFPPLDGGRMLMITLKRLFGARISLRAEQLTYVVGFVFLFAFIIWVSGFDLARALGAAPASP